MIKFDVGQYKYTVKRTNDDRLSISAIHNKKFDKWKLIYDQVMPVQSPLSIGNLYNLFKDYIDNKNQMLVSFEFPNVNICQQINLDIKIMFKIQSWSGSHDDIKVITLMNQHRTNEIKMMKRLDSKLDELKLNNINEKNQIKDIINDNFTPYVSEYLNSRFTNDNSRMNDIVTIILEAGLMKNQISLLDISIICDLLVYNNKQVAIRIAKIILKHK
jgi:hypothetical protein